LNPPAIGAALASEAAATVPTKDKLEVVFYRDYRMDDGRFNNNGWIAGIAGPDHEADVGKRGFNERQDGQGPRRLC